MSVRVDPKQVLLNVIAGVGPVFTLARWLRDRGRPPRHQAVVADVLSRLRVRRAGFGDARIRGADILEIGSGRDFGLAVLLVAIGARRVVNVEIERYGFVWNPEFYRLLVESARLEGIDLPWPPPGLLEQGTSVAPDLARITLHLGRSAAAIPQPDASFDLTFSVSVLQHVRRENVVAVAGELHRVTRPGGIGRHRIDFTDLENAEPFRHLCYTHDQYRLMYQHRTSYSNRFRMDDFERIFRAAGFAEVAFEDVRLYEDEAEFERWLPEFDDEFREKPLQILRARGCMLVLRR